VLRQRRKDAGSVALDLDFKHETHLFMDFKGLGGSRFLFFLIPSFSNKRVRIKKESFRSWELKPFSELGTT
jgi:hypothetical protein